MRNKIIKIVTFLGGIYFFLEFILPKLLLDKLQVSTYHEAISDGFILVGSMAFGLGLINLFMSHGSRIAFMRKGWFNSSALLIGLLFTMGVAGLEWFGQIDIQKKVAGPGNLSDFAKKISTDIDADTQGLPDVSTRIYALSEATKNVEIQIQNDAVIFADELVSSLQANPIKLKEYEQNISDLKRVIDQFEASRTKLTATNTQAELVSELNSFASQLNEVSSFYGQLLRQAAEISLVARVWSYLFNGLFVALGSAMFSLLGVYIASAAYRAFRVRTFESSLMMLAAIIVMLGQIPFGVWIYEGLPEIRLWLMEYPSSAAFRAIKIGAAVAGLVMALRMWFSIESDYSLRVGK